MLAYRACWALPSDGVQFWSTCYRLSTSAGSRKFLFRRACSRFWRAGGEPRASGWFLFWRAGRGNSSCGASCRRRRFLLRHASRCRSGRRRASRDLRRCCYIPLNWSVSSDEHGRAGVWRDSRGCASSGRRRRTVWCVLYCSEKPTTTVHCTAPRPLQSCSRACSRKSRSRI